MKTVTFSLKRMRPEYLRYTLRLSDHEDAFEIMQMLIDRKIQSVPGQCLPHEYVEEWQTDFDAGPITIVSELDEGDP